MSEGKEAEQAHIGQKLKDARVAKGMTLDDLQQETKIQKRYLIAIEDEKFDELPGDFYVRAFVKQYANTVGLDGNDLLKQYDDYLPKTQTETYTEHLDEAVETRTGQHHQNTVDRIDQLRKYLPTIIVVLIVVVVLGAIWLTAIVRNHNNSSTKIDSSSVKVSGESSHKKAKKTTKKADTIKLHQTQRTDSAVTFKSDKSLKKSTKLTVSTTGDSNNVVRVDDRQRLSKNMSNGDKSTVTIAKNVHSITIRVGNARNTKIKIGNQTGVLPTRPTTVATRAAITRPTTVVVAVPANQTRRLRAHQIKVATVVLVVLVNRLLVLLALQPVALLINQGGSYFEFTQ